MLNRVCGAITALHETNYLSEGCTPSAIYYPCIVDIHGATLMWCKVVCHILTLVDCFAAEIEARDTLVWIAFEMLLLSTTCAFHEDFS